LEERTGHRYMGLHCSNGYKVGVGQPRPIAALEVRLDDCCCGCGDIGASGVRTQAEELSKTSAANADKSPSPSPIIRIFSELVGLPPGGGADRRWSGPRSRLQRRGRSALRALQYDLPSTA
jgi:hypothetical protein